MRHRVKEYDIIAPYAIDIAGNVRIEDIRLIVNETQGVVICSSMQKGNIVAIGTGSESTTLSINPSVCTLNTDDILTIEIDKGDTLTQVQRKVEEVGNKIDNIKLPEVDTTELAKQGENIHATNTAIYESLKSSSGYIKMTNSEYDEFKAHIIEVTNNILN